MRHLQGYPEKALRDPLAEGLCPGTWGAGKGARCIRVLVAAFRCLCLWVHSCSGEFAPHAPSPPPSVTQDGKTLALWLQDPGLKLGCWVPRSPQNIILGTLSPCLCAQAQLSNLAVGVRPWLSLLPSP